MEKQGDRWQVELSMGSKVAVDSIVHGCELDLGVCTTLVDLHILSLGSYGVVLGMDWLESHHDSIDYRGKRVKCLDDSGKSVEIVGVQRPISLHMMFPMQLEQCAW